MSLDLQDQTIYCKGIYGITVLRVERMILRVELGVFVY